MSSFLANIPAFTLTNLFHLLIIFGAAVMVNRVLLAITTKMIVKPASTPARSAQAREQQTKTLADDVYRIGSKTVWGIALLTAAEEIGINTWPIVVFAGLAAFAVALGAQGVMRDMVSGFYIATEDQFAVGDTVQIGEVLGRVEQLTLRRTVIRDSRGALVTIANGEIRMAGNLSRDWSQSFVDVAISPLVPQEKAFAALDAAASELRADASWSQALVDGPRILGLQSYDQSASTIRLQVRTAPARQEDVARELRRRIQLEFQRQGIPLSEVRRVEVVSPAASQGNVQSASAA